MPIPGRYWDSNTFLGWLNGEPSKFHLCDAVIEAAKEGKVRIATSSLTYVEVYWTKRGTKLSADQQKQIGELFDYSWIVPVDLDTPTAKIAREIMWKFPHIKSWDSVHVASAIKARRLGAIECFDTFDGDLIKLTGQLDGTDLRLAIPDLPPKYPLLAASGVSIAPVPPSAQSPGVASQTAAPLSPAPPSDPPRRPRATAAGFFSERSSADSVNEMTRWRTSKADCTSSRFGRLAVLDRLGMFHDGHIDGGNARTKAIQGNRNLTTTRDFGYTSPPAYGHAPLRHQFAWSMAMDGVDAEVVANVVADMRHAAELEDERIPDPYKDED